jgi:hypothetical protein
MTLQEKAFMCDLIKKTYRRRMFIFYMFVIAIGTPILFIIFGHQTSMFNVLLASISFIFLLTAVFYYNQSKYLSLMPWNLKNKQVEALESYSKSNFKDLICSVPLKEYFTV